MKVKLKKVVFMVVGVALFFAACRKEDDFIDKPVNLRFSTDSVLFDTVFTTIGSHTEWLKVYNPSDQNIKLDYIRLAGGDESNFRINVNGVAASGLSDVEIMANDSVFLFIEVTVDPNQSNLPLVITDSIVFSNKGKVQDIQLAAWGQDAHFIVADTKIEGLPKFKIVAGEGDDITWTNDKPYVVYGYAVVDSTGILRIDPGVQVHFHANSGLWVYKGGAIKVNGTMNEPVVFQGDRQEDYYEDKPGQWDRIWLNESSIDHEFNYAIIKNGFIGIQCELLQEDMGNQLVLNNTIIQDMSGAGILSRSFRINATNTVIGNCQQYATALTLGGDYSFKHCTFANYWNYSVRKKPAVYVNNYFVYNEEPYPADLNNAYFGNCIIYGSVENELELDDQSTGTFNYAFDNCLIRTSIDFDANFNDCIKNESPDFTDYDINDFTLLENSAAIDQGNESIAEEIPEDIAGNSRTSNPDIGAYEYQPE